MSDNQQPDPASIVELQPEWTQVDLTELKGRVEVYIDTVIDGVTYQTSPTLAIEFKRFGDTPEKCEGILTLYLDAGEDPGGGLIGKTPMLYGPVGNPLKFVSEGWDTHACDTIFQDVGGLTWGEIFDQLKDDNVPQSLPPVEDKRTPPPIPGQEKTPPPPE